MKQPIRVLFLTSILLLLTAAVSAVKAWTGDTHIWLSGYKKIHGIAIVVNAIVEEVKRVKRIVVPFYHGKSKPIRVNVASLEDTLILKALLWRDRDIVDVCLLLLSSSGSIDTNQLRLL